MDAASVVKIRKLLRQCDYTVTVNHTSEGCSATFPVRLIEPVYPAVKINYSVLPEGIHYSDDTVEEVWDGPVYARRLSVLCDIVKRCSLYEYNIGLIRFIRNNKRMETIFDILDHSMELEHMEKEAILLYTLSEIKFGGNKKDLPEILDMVSKYDIMPGFEYLRFKFSL